MSKKVTSREMIERLLDLEYEHALLEEDTPEKATAQIAMTLCKKEMAKKVENIDGYSVELSRQENLIDAELSTLRTEISRLMSHKNAIKRTKEYFNKVLLPMLIETAGNDNVLRTSTAKYTLYQTWGPLEVTDEEAVPDKYKRAKIEVDKKGARKDVIEAAENDMGIAGFAISKTKRIRRS